MKTPTLFKRVALAAATFFCLASAQASQVRLNLNLGQELVPAGSSHKMFVKIGLAGLPGTDRKSRPPINVAIVLDRSGSMSGEKIENAKRAAIMALDYLGPEDIVSLVIYDHMVEVPVPATRMTDRSMIEAAIRAITARGNTALFAGVSKGAAELAKFQERHKINRMVLLSDGLANVGPSTPAELGRLGRQLGGQGIPVTTIGLGLDYNEDLMVRLAGSSDGNHVFAERPSELARVFKSEFGELGTVVAQQVTITIQCRDGVRPLRVLGREAEIIGDKVVARVNQLYAEQEKYLLLEVEAPAGSDGSERELVAVEAAYDDLAGKRQEKLSSIARVRYTGSGELAAKSVNTGVAVSATEQIGAELDEKAIELKDKGDVAGAQSVFRQKSEILKRDAEKYNAPALRAQSEKAKKAEEAVAAPKPEAWDKARKELREDQYSVQKQQSYK